MALVKKDGKYGFINAGLKEIILPQYEIASSFSEGLAMVKIGSKFSFINQQGKQVMSRKFDFAGVFHNGEALVGLGKEKFMINTKGKILREVEDHEDHEKEEREERETATRKGLWRTKEHPHESRTIDREGEEEKKW